MSKSNKKKTLIVIGAFLAIAAGGGVSGQQPSSIAEIKRNIIPAYEIRFEYEKLKYETSPAGRAEQERSNQYNQLIRVIREKNNTFTENEYRELAEQLRAMNGYKDTAQLASEYERLYNTLKTHRERLQFQYDWLVQEKNRADREEQYQELAQNFLAMDGYKDTAQLAHECNTLYHILKERRESAERAEARAARARAREIEGTWRQLGSYQALGDIAVKFNLATGQHEMTTVKILGTTLGPGGITNVLYDGSMWSFDVDLGGYKTAKFLLRKENATTFVGTMEGTQFHRWIKIR